MLSRLALALLFLSTSLAAEEWNRFRGPNGAGRIGDELPDDATLGEVAFTAELPGAGNSSPVLWGDKLFITAADQEAGTRWLLCLDAKSGEEQWRQGEPFSAYKKHKNNTFATSTPCCDADRVYVLWQSPAGSPLIAYDHAGEEQWRFDLGKWKSGHGPATSPIVEQGLVLISNDGEGEAAFLIALDSKSGEEVWRVQRETDRACYSTPCLFAAPDGTTEAIFTHSYRGIWGVNLKTGDKRWAVDCFGRFAQRACASPVIYKDLVIGTSGFTTAEKNVVAVKVTPWEEMAEPPGAPVVASETYRVSKQAPHVPTPLIVGDTLYLWTDRGIVSRVDVRTGEVLQTKRVGGNAFGSPVAVGGRIVGVTQTGEVIVLDGETLDEVQRVDLEEPSYASPAVTQRALYVRTLSAVHALPIE